MQHLIQQLEDHQQAGRTKVLCLIGLIGATVVMANGDIRLVLVGTIEDKTVASSLYLIYAAAAGFIIYKSVFKLKNLEFGKWPIYMQMLDVVKKKRVIRLTELLL